jgi:predicted ATPase
MSCTPRWRSSVSTASQNFAPSFSAAQAPHQLYQSYRLKLEFERTASRLIEMQSRDYLALPHRA